MRSQNNLHCVIQAALLSLICLIVSPLAFAKNQDTDRIVVFGASLSDTGNAFVLLSDPAAFGFSEDCNMGTPLNVPPYDALDAFLVPDGTYARGGHHVTNGATWIEQLARGKGLSGNVRPALRNVGTQASNYAVGGARASDYNACRFNLADQMQAYQDDSLPISANTLFVFEMGGNDVRDALATANPALLNMAIDKIGDAILSLYGQGARKFLLVNVPDIAQTPAVKKLDTMFPDLDIAANATALTVGFNTGLALLQDNLNGLFGAGTVRTLNLYQLLNTIIATPSDFGIVNTWDACVTPNAAPYTCQNPDSYLFWDGIHPTKVVHDIMAQEAAETLADAP